MNESLEDAQVHGAVSDWAADEWKRQYDHARTLLGDAMEFVQHTDLCRIHLDRQDDCNCGLWGWEQAVARLTA